MYNHFRTLLLNEDRATMSLDSESITMDSIDVTVDMEGSNFSHIPVSFNKQQLDYTLDKMYQVFVPKDASYSVKVFIVYNYLQLIRAAGLEEDLSLFDQRFTYNLNDHRSFFKSAPRLFNFAGLLQQLESSGPLIHDMLSYEPSFDTTKYVNIWYQHFNPVYRVSALLIAFVARLDKFYHR